MPSYFFCKMYYLYRTWSCAKCFMYEPTLIIQDSVLIYQECGLDIGFFKKAFIYSFNLFKTHSMNVFSMSNTL